MRNKIKVKWSWMLIASLFVGVLRLGQAQAPVQQELPVKLVGFADRWADYGSRSDTPSFRDFLAILKTSGNNKGSFGQFIKIRIMYWPQDKSDPKQLAEYGPYTMVFNAAREVRCDETFADLSREGQVSFLDPQLAKSHFLRLPDAPTKMPLAKSMLPCYEVK
jgi:hypothetical protein